MNTYEDQQNKFGFALLALAVLLFFFGAWLTAPTEEDLERCVEATNYTYEQCQHKLSL